MVNVVPQSGDFKDGHEVVLTKAFQHGGETWYEMMDSNQGPLRRLYLSAKQLNTMLQENGVAYRHRPGDGAAQIVERHGGTVRAEWPSAAAPRLLQDAADGLGLGAAAG